MEILQKQVRDIVSAVSRLPFSEEAKAEIIKMIETHAKTSFETVKRVYEESK